MYSVTLRRFISLPIAVGIVFLLVFSFSAKAQNVAYDSTKLYRVETNDGNEYIGKILERTQTRLRIRTVRLGDLTLQTLDIVRIESIEESELRAGLHWFDNPQATRYFFQPNGYGLKKGEAYYQNIWVLFNQVSVGVTNNFSIGLGMVPTFLLGETDGMPVWITPKFSLPLVDDKVNVGLGVLYGGALGSGEGGVGIAYGVSTFGNKDKNFSFGLGYGFSDGQLADAPTITFSTMIRTGQRGYFLSENYFISVPGEQVAIISLGGRRIIKRAGLDFGLFAPFATGQTDFFAIPWLGMTFRLDKRKD